MGNFKVKYALSVAIMLLLSQIILGFATMQRAMAAKPVFEESQIISEFSTVSQQDSIRNANARRVAQRSRRTQEEQRNAASSISTNTTPASVDTVNVTALADTTQRKSKGGMGLGAPIVGRAQDSLYYDLRSKKVYLYEKGEVTYGNMSLAADKMTIDLDLKNIYAIGKTDTIDGEPTVTRPLFSQGTTSLNMDTITYNIESQRAKIKNIATQQGDGWMVGQDVKRLSDNTINIADGMYTTCDQTDHPHFFYSMSKVKVIPGKKAIMGPGHLVIEDVHIPFLGLPEGFFPLSSGPKSGILMPSYGEEARRGFYIRGLGYYFTFSDHIDLTLTGGIYTLGSWEVNAISRYMKRYKYTGNFNFDFSSIRSGDKGDPDFVKWLWWLIPLIGWVGMMIWGKHDNGAKNYIDRVISIIWSVIGVSFLWIMFAFVYYHAPILFLVILLAGMGTTMTGFVIRDKATQIGGILAMVSSILFPLKHWLMIRFVDLNDIALQSEWMSTDFLLFAAIFLFMMVIPGHILNHKYNK